MPLYKDDFLLKLQSQHIQKKYARITLLDWAERPIRSIEGEITGGSINIDGNSAIRTTISLSMISKVVDLTKYKIALRSKVKIDIGLLNEIESEYPSIIWFKQGIFIVTNFNSSVGISQSSISISGKDKMCLLNGEISGSIPAQTDFGQIDTYENTYQPISFDEYKPNTYYYKEQINNKSIYYLDRSYAPSSNRQYYEKKSTVTTEKLNLKDIIINMVYVWGHEAKAKIIVNDLDLAGNELLEYRGETPIYLIKEKDTNSNVFLDLVLDPNYVVGNKKISELGDGYYSLNVLDNAHRKIYSFSIGDKEYVVVKVSYGETLGYRATDLTFAGDLIAGVGENVVTILDKLKNMLGGNYEYFYDVDGYFVFQAKHTYELVNFTKYLVDGNGEIYLDGSYYNNKIHYSFTDEDKNTQISHTPNLSNLRNDYSIWGERKAASGNKVQIHLRYALQQKPEEYTTIGDGPRSGMHLKTKASNSQEQEISDNILTSIYNELLKLYDAQQDYDNSLSEIQNNYNNNLVTQKSEIQNFIINWISKFIISSEENEDGTITYQDIEGEIPPIPATNNVRWFQSFVNEYNTIARNLNSNLNSTLNSLCSIIIEQYYKNPTEVKALYSFLQNFVYQRNSDYNPINSNNADIAFLWDRIANFSEQYLIENYLEQYDNNWDYAFYYAYTNSQKYYNEIISNLELQIKDLLLSNQYESALQKLLDLWQVKIYLLYINIFAKIDRTIKSDLESGEADQKNYLDSDYNYIKSGAVYNFGKPQSDYQSFITNNYNIIFEDWLFIENKYESFAEIYSRFTAATQTIDIYYSSYADLVDQLHQAELYYYNYLYETKNRIIQQNISLIVDWRELIYQMARDYYDYGENPKYNYLNLLFESNKTMLNDDYTTGYEPFYTDLISNWRSLYYNPILEALDYDIYAATGNEITDYNGENSWLIMVKEYPSNLNFWFDFTEGQEGLNEYIVSKIGDRLKAIKNNAISSIYYKDVPDIIYYDNKNKQYITTENYNENSYSFFQLGGELSNLYSISTQGKSAFDELQDLLYKFTYCTENITITTLPIYTLKPNYRIAVQSKIPGLTDEYIINRITVPLVYNGTMSINATKAVPYLGIQ